MIELKQLRPQEDVRNDPFYGKVLSDMYENAVMLADMASSRDHIKPERIMSKAPRQGVMSFVFGGEKPVDQGSGWQIVSCHEQAFPGGPTIVRDFPGVILRTDGALFTTRLARQAEGVITDTLHYSYDLVGAEDLSIKTQEVFTHRLLEETLSGLNVFHQKLFSSW